MTQTKESPLLDDATVAEMLKDVDIVAQNHHYAVPLGGDLCCHIRALASEREAMIAILHANRCHPDWTYSIAPGHYPAEANFAMFESGETGCWEKNPEYKAAPGDVCWRRRIEP